MRRRVAALDRSRGGAGALLRSATPGRSQEEQRERRRHHQPVAYDGAFDLAAEVRDICRPLAQRVTTLPRLTTETRAGELVIELVEAVHETASIVAGWLAESEALRATAHLADQPTKRANAVRLCADLSPPPMLPVVTDEGLRSGVWVATLVRLCGRFSDQLSELLSRSYPPNDDRLREAPSRSERLERALRPVDLAAASLNRYLDRIAKTPPHATPAAAGCHVSGHR